MMSGDHLVQLAHAPPSRSVVRARDIAPKDHVVVHSVTTKPVQVSSVSPMQAAELVPGRVTVTVNQSDRNAVLVASGAQGWTGVGSVAVGSADLVPSQIEALRTFLHAPKLLASPRSAAGRSLSWPLSCHSPALTTSCSLAPPGQQRSPSSTGTASNSAPGSTQDSDSETLSDGETAILLPWILPGQAGQRTILAGEAQAAGSVAALLQARREGWPSMGSAGHPTCRPCYFAHRGRCSAGVWCPRCHLRHVRSNGKLRSR